jgi:hypothetical protein
MQPARRTCNLNPAQGESGRNQAGSGRKELRSRKSKGRKGYFSFGVFKIETGHFVSKIGIFY